MLENDVIRSRNDLTISDALNKLDYPKRSFSGRVQLISFRELALLYPKLVINLSPAKEKTIQIQGREIRAASNQVMRLPGAYSSVFAVIWKNYLLVDDIHYVPSDWISSAWNPLVFEENLTELKFEVESIVEEPCLYVDDMNAHRTFGHFMREQLPYSFIQRQLDALSVGVAAIGQTSKIDNVNRLRSKYFLKYKEVSPKWHLFRDLYVAERQYCSDEAAVGIPRIPIEGIRFVADFDPSIAELRKARPTIEKLYLVRKWGEFGDSNLAPQQGRNFENGAEIDNLLEELGFTFINASEIDPSNLERIIASSSLIIGLNGSQLTNVMWMNEKAMLFEIFGPDGGPNWIEGICRALGTKYSHILADRINGRVILNINILRERIESAMEELKH